MKTYDLVQKMLSHLTSEAQIEVLKLYFGIDSDKEHTFEEIAKIRDTSVASAKRVYEKALRLLQSNDNYIVRFEHEKSKKDEFIKLKEIAEDKLEEINEAV